MQRLEFLLEQILQEIKDLHEDMNNGFNFFTRNQDELRAVVEQLAKAIEAINERRQS